MNLPPEAPLTVPGREFRKHTLPPLTYDYSALEPFIDGHILLRHHVLHHGTAVTKLNAALVNAPAFWESSALWLLCNLDKVPDGIREDVGHSASGHLNHSMYWRAMKPGAGGAPKGGLGQAISRDFGSFANFKNRFESAAAKLAGTGWVWLTVSGDKRGLLEIVTTTGHEHPMTANRVPVLLNDVWDHAYSSRQPGGLTNYLQAWWSVVDWDQASRCFSSVSGGIQEPWDAK